MAKATKLRKFPQTIYVQHHGQVRKDDCFSAARTAKDLLDFQDGAHEIGVYVLKETQRVKVVTSVEPA